jgi:hypothetical protein
VRPHTYEGFDLRGVDFVVDQHLRDYIVRDDHGEEVFPVSEVIDAQVKYNH